jgi:hypothetical protein
MAKKPSPNTQVAETATSQTWATWIASVTAVFAFVISLFSLYESHEARVAALRDELIVRARRPMGDTLISIHKVNGSLKLGVIRAPWDVLISNTGSSTVSITGYEVLELRSNLGKVEGQLGEVSYSSLDRGLLSPESGQVVGLPLTLEAGKSVHLLLLLGLIPGDKAYKVLLTAIGDREASLPLLTAEKLLAKSGIDMYDNPVTLLPSGWRVEKQGKEQIFLLKFRTARGTEIREITSWYSLKSF